MNDYDQYYEPSEADFILEEYSEKMKTALLSSVKSEIDRIKEKNAKLEEENKRMQTAVNEISRREYMLKIERENMLSDVKKMRIDELMEDLYVTLYKAESRSYLGEKCNKCDENRKLKYLTPRGKEAEELCECGSSKYKYVPSEQRICEFTVRGKSFIAWYKQSGDSDYYQSSSVPDVVIDGDTNFAELKCNSTYFRAVEQCQAYCDWLNAKGD